MGSLGWPEIIAILVIVLVIFGPKRLPEIGKSLGKGIKEFKKSTTELQEHITGDDSKAPQVQQAAAPEAAPVAAPAPAAAPAETAPAPEAAPEPQAAPVTAPEPVAAPEPKTAAEPKSPETKTS